ncbi:hypothetical protein IWW37_002187, partial [Coemansia sp. RSA 2050]
EPATATAELAAEPVAEETVAEVATLAVEEATSEAPVVNTSEAVVEPTEAITEPAATEPTAVAEDIVAEPIEKPAPEAAVPAVEAPVADEEFVVIESSDAPRDLAAVSEPLIAAEPVVEEPAVDGTPAPMDLSAVAAVPSRLDDSGERIAPVVVGTIEALESPLAAEAVADTSAASRAVQEPVSWSSPQSQVSYNRTDSQLSLSEALNTSAPVEGEPTREISGRDSAVYMGGASGNQTPEESPKEAPRVPEEARIENTREQTVPEPELEVEATSQTVPPQYSAFSTPAFPEYFTHSETPQQQQQVGSGVATREIPRASTGGAQKAPTASRPKDVLMELNIETPSDGRQLLQLRMTDDLDEVCEEFCVEHGMIDLLPGMKALVRGKVERRLARRRERALQAAVAPGGRYAPQ